MIIKTIMRLFIKREISVYNNEKPISESESQIALQIYLCIFILLLFSVYNSKT